MNRKIIRILMSITPLLLESCVFSLRPLSDDKTSTLDKRLFGTWMKLKGDWGDDVITVGKKEGTKGK